MKGDFLILIVDDSRMNRMVLSKHLSQEGYELLEAEGADAALKILDYRKPDLILLDVVMPEMSGFDLCKLLKQQPSTQEVPIIFITSLDSTEDKIAGLELGPLILLQNLSILLRLLHGSAHRSNCGRCIGPSLKQTNASPRI